MYEGDGIIHSEVETSGEEFAGPAKSLLETAGVAAFAGPYVDLCEIEKTARKSRAAALAALISRFLDWIDAGIQRAKYRDLENYLAKSTDLADLEHRMRRIEGEPRNMLPVG
ncbi:MAG: DUF3563 family protein [Betaproteobacteria bacterium]|nr:DUF3563 family protein [Betaproteobacteria bacterium]